jgi:hypothetical protein
MMVTLIVIVEVNTAMPSQCENAHGFDLLLHLLPLPAGRSYTQHLTHNTSHLTPHTQHLTPHTKTYKEQQTNVGACETGLLAQADANVACSSCQCAAAGS